MSRRLYLVIIHQYWLMSYNKYTINVTLGKKMLCTTRSTLLYIENCSQKDGLLIQ